MQARAGGGAGPRLHSSHAQLVTCGSLDQAQRRRLLPQAHAHGCPHRCRHRSGRRRGEQRAALAQGPSSHVIGPSRAAAGEPGPPADAPQPRSLFIFGFGYVALGLASLLRAQGWRVTGTCRGVGHQRELQALGFETFLFDTDRVNLGLGKEGVRALRQASHVLVTISPSSPRELCPVMWMLGREFKALAGRLAWVGFLSTTSVYGDHGGDWVTEESEARAAAGNGLARRTAEVSWQRFAAATGLPVHTFRLAGIYGPGRSAIEAAQQDFLSKRAGKRFTSRCHVYDVCQVLMASMARPQPGAVYNVVDDDPTSREAVLAWVRQHLLPPAAAPLEAAAPPPPAEAAAAKPRPPRRTEEKRVSNARVKRELGVSLAFPSYRDGLRAIHAGNLTPFE